MKIGFLCISKNVSITYPVETNPYKKAQCTELFYIVLTTGVHLEEKLSKEDVDQSKFLGKLQRNVCFQEDSDKRIEHRCHFYSFFLLLFDSELWLSEMRNCCQWLSTWFRTRVYNNNEVKFFYQRIKQNIFTYGGIFTRKKWWVDLAVGILIVKSYQERILFHTYPFIRHDTSPQILDLPFPLKYFLIVSHPYKCLRNDFVQFLHKQPNYHDRPKLRRISAVAIILSKFQLIILKAPLRYINMPAQLQQVYSSWTKCNTKVQSEESNKTKSLTSSHKVSLENQLLIFRSTIPTFFWGRNSRRNCASWWSSA